MTRRWVVSAFAVVAALASVGPLAISAQAATSTPAPRCAYVVGYQVNLGADLTDPATRAMVLTVVRTAATALGANTGQTYRFDGLTSFVPTQENLASAPDDLVIAFINPKTTDFFGPADLPGERILGWTRWLSTGGTITAASTVIDSQSHWFLPSGLTLKGGPSLLALVEHEMGHSVGLLHSTDRSTTMYPEQSALTPATYSPADATLLRASACRASITR